MIFMDFPDFMYSLVCLDLFVACRIRIIDLGMWTADVFVRTFVQAEFSNIFLLKNNDI